MVATKPNAFYVNQELTCLLQTRVPVIFKRQAKKTIRRETISAKVNNFFTLSERKSDNTVLVVEGAFLFHTVKHPSS